MDLDSLPRGVGGVLPSARARSIGVSASLLTARDAGELVAVRRGVYVPARFDELPAVEQHRTRAFAVANQRPGVVFAGFTAAVLQGMPVVGGVPGEVVVLATKESGRRRNGVVEIVRRSSTHVMTTDGVMTTSPVDTLIEVARTRPLLTALTMADAALYRSRLDDGPVPLCTIEELRQSFAAMLPFPGSRRVAAVLDRATHLAETPLETLSRVRIDDLGFPQPDLQRSVWRPRSRSLAFLDFAWPEHGVWGEADGDGKYLGNARRTGDRRSVAEIVRDEKARENEVRAATRWACARWGWDDAWRSGPLRDILLEAGLPRVR